jgi:hypothetical protein
MKNDTTTTILNFVLAAFVGMSMVLAIFANHYTNQLPTLTVQAQQAGNSLMRLQALGNDVATYNATTKSPELTRILQSAQAKPAAAH